MNNAEMTEYIEGSIDRLVRSVLGKTMNDPAEALFLLRFATSAKRSGKKRAEYEKKGIHVPGFLISSITTDCNLHCKGCYARVNGICGSVKRKELSDVEWLDVISQANDAGVSFNILAGGEPLMRRSLIEAVAKEKEMVFPIFTNGTMIDGDYIKLFSKNRNLIPVVSIEGKKDATDLRRGSGVYDTVIEKMNELTSKGIFHGASVTVTTENIDEVTSQDFIDILRRSGVGIVFYIEYVPGKKDACMAFGDGTRPQLESAIDRVRGSNGDLVVMSFPGDEKVFGGCIGAGRGFFHINPFGDAEACPASPYHDRNLKDSSFMEVLRSPLFVKIREEGLMDKHHTGGCVLSEKDDIVRKMVAVPCVSDDRSSSIVLDNCL